MKYLACLLLLVYSFSGSSQNNENPSPYQETYVVIAGESEDFVSLEKSAKDLSVKTSIKYDAGGLTWNKDKGLVFPEDSDDEIYAGGYYMRRFDDNRISIEMRDYYFDVKPDRFSKKMIIIAGIYGSKEEARKRLKEVKKHVPSAYIRKTTIYMGCIH